jgi:hypothetical protein
LAVNPAARLISFGMTRRPAASMVLFMVGIMVIVAPGGKIFCLFESCQLCGWRCEA